MDNRDTVAEGGLMSYAPDQTDIFRAQHPTSITFSRGRTPAIFAVQARSNSSLSSILKTAKTLGLTLSPDLLAIATK